MKRSSIAAGLMMSFVLVSGVVIHADVKTREKGQVTFEGMLGTMVNMFGGKGAREGIVSSNAVKGNRKATVNDTTGRIVDLGEEKVYELDMKKKEYKVTTFEELRQRMREAQARAAENAKKQQGGQEEAQKPEKEVEVDFDVKETGEKKSIAGYDARQVVMTITVREKGRTLDESGGIVITADNWIGPQIPAMKELIDFELKYFKAIAPETAGVSAEQMAAVLALYPMVKQGMERMGREAAKFEGTPLATTMRFEGVKSKEQMTQQQNQGSGGGLSGMLARRMMKRGDDKPRATIFTSTSETLEIATSVAQTEVDIPAGFKEKK